jgi:hypothetical protein
MLLNGLLKSASPILPFAPSKIIRIFCTGSVHQSSKGGKKYIEYKQVIGG